MGCWSFQNCPAKAIAGCIGVLGLVLSTIPVSCKRRWRSLSEGESLLLELHFSQAVTTLRYGFRPLIGE